MFTLCGPDDLKSRVILDCCISQGIDIDFRADNKTGLSILQKSSNAAISVEFPLHVGSLVDQLKKMERHVRFPDCILLITGKFFPHTEVYQPNGKRTLSLTEKECDLLLNLWQALPNTLSKQELLEQVWGYKSELETHTLETHIYRLRQKIELDPANPQNLITDKSGYRLVLAE